MGKPKNTTTAKENPASPKPRKRKQRFCPKCQKKVRVQRKHTCLVRKQIDEKWIHCRFCPSPGLILKKNKARHMRLVHGFDSQNLFMKVQNHENIFRNPLKEVKSQTCQKVDIIQQVDEQLSPMSLPYYPCACETRCFVCYNNYIEQLNIVMECFVQVNKKPRQAEIKGVQKKSRRGSL